VGAGGPINVAVCLSMLDGMT